MTVQQVTRIECALLKHFNRVRVTGILAEVEFLPGKTWQPISFTSGTGQFTEKPKQADAGVYYSSEVKCSMVTDNKEALSFIDKLEHSDIVVRVMYNSGDWKIMGIHGIPVKLTSEIDVGKSGGYKLTFACDSINRGCFLKA